MRESCSVLLTKHRNVFIHHVVRPRTKMTVSERLNGQSFRVRRSYPNPAPEPYSLACDRKRGRIRSTNLAQPLDNPIYKPQSSERVFVRLCSLQTNANQIEFDFSLAAIRSRSDQFPEGAICWPRMLAHCRPGATTADIRLPPLGTGKYLALAPAKKTRCVPHRFSRHPEPLRRGRQLTRRLNIKTSR
jgi:hypothetical protein